MKIACVYKTGGDFDEDYVISLYDSFKRYDVDFICFTDSNRVPYHIPQRRLIHKWPGWWSKIEMIGSGEDLLCFDLDTVIIDDIKDMIDLCNNEPDNMIMLRGFYTPQNPASGIMYVPKESGLLLYSLFLQDPNYYMNMYRGDQDFIREEYNGQIDRWQYVLDKDYICSYKAHITKSYPTHIRPLEVDPTKSKIMCFHGKPRPKDVKDIWNVYCNNQ